ncbi:MAG TPA: efflux RND transporter periplasmic adaptor subunit [Burkholderiaceae bacterium]
MEKANPPDSPGRRLVSSLTRAPLAVLKWMLAAAALAVALWLAFGPSAIKVELARVEQGPMQVTVDNQGRVRMHDVYVVAAPVAGALQRVELHEGDPVRKGQLVASLRPLPMDARQKQEAAARLEAAKALAREAELGTQKAYTDLQLATSEQARVEQLIKGNFISPQAADKTRAGEAAARALWNAAKSRERAAFADVKAAEAALASSGVSGAAARPIPLYSPVDGYIVKIDEKSERTVNTGTPLMGIGDPARYEIVVDVLSTDAVKIQPGDTMLLDGWGGGKTLRAEVKLVEPVAFTKISALGVEEQRVNVLADPVDALGPLGDGYRIEARIVVWSAQRTLKVAGSSVFRVGDAWHVFVVDHGRAQEKEVETGRRNRDEVQILGGLAPGAYVVRYPGTQIRSGVRVEAMAGQ